MSQAEFPRSNFLLPTLGVGASPALSFGCAHSQGGNQIIFPEKKFPTGKNQYLCAFECLPTRPPPGGGGKTSTKKKFASDMSNTPPLVGGQLSKGLDIFQ